MRVRGEIKRNGMLVAYGLSELIAFSGPGIRVYSNNNLLSWTDVNYSNELEEQIIRSGRFPEGTYTFCVKLLNESGNDTFAMDCESYILVLPRTPTLLTPPNNDFGAFVSITTEIDVVHRMITLSGVRGGFFYNAEPGDVELVRSKSVLTGDPFDTMSVQPARFAIFLYASVRVVSEWAAEGRALLTVTGREFILDTKVVILHMQDKITDYAHFGVGFHDFYAVGNIDVKVDMVSLIQGEGTFDFYVYDTDAWGIMGGVDVKLFRFIDLESSFFVGPPGFMFESSAKFGFDIWIISISAGFEGDIWYIQSDF